MLRPPPAGCRLPAIAAGVVVSRGSPGGERLSSGSLWSSREVVSPSDRQKAVSAAGPPIRAKQQVGAGVVAELDDRLAHVGDRHRAGGEILFGDRRVVEQVGLAVGDHGRKLLLAAIGPRQHAGRERSLERRAHDEALVGAPCELRASREVLGIDPDPPAALALVGFELRRCVYGERGGGGHPAQRGEQGTAVERHGVSGEDFADGSVVIASAAKQSRSSPRRQTGLLRCARNDGKCRGECVRFRAAEGSSPHSLRSYRYDFDTICQPSASFIATR